eukprot:6216731-Heterocapsa_arctica.AAC.1
MGRQIAFIIYAHFQMSPNMDFSYRISDLTELKWHGDHSIPSFLYLWRQIVMRMKIQLPTEMLMDTLHSKMEGSKLMENDLAHFNRQDEGHPDRSYEYLLNVMDKNIGIQQQAANREANTKAIRAGHLGLKGAPAINIEGLSKTAKKKAA